MYSLPTNAFNVQKNLCFQARSSLNLFSFVQIVYKLIWVGMFRWGIIMEKFSAEEYHKNSNKQRTQKRFVELKKNMQQRSLWELFYE